MKHILFDLKGCPADLLDDARHVRNSLFHASLISNSKITNGDDRNKPKLQRQAPTPMHLELSFEASLQNSSENDGFPGCNCPNLVVLSD